MKKTLIAAIIASELPKPCITLDLFKSDGCLRAYGGAAGGGKEYFWKTVGDSTPRHGAKTEHRKGGFVWFEESAEFDLSQWLALGQAAGFEITPVMGFDPWKPQTPEQIAEDIKKRG